MIFKTKPNRKNKTEQKKHGLFPKTEREKPNYCRKGATELVGWPMRVPPGVDAFTDATRVK
jgi:hypothetical protein